SSRARGSLRSRVWWGHARVPAGVRDGAAGLRHAVEAHVRAGHLEAARILLGDGDGVLVGVRPGAEDHGLLEGAGHQLAEAGGQLDLLHVEVRRARVDQGIGALLNGLGDPGMVVPESRAHLTGVVVEVFLARDVADDRSTRPLEDRAGEYALVEAVAKGVLAGEGQHLIFPGRGGG